MARSTAQEKINNLGQQALNLGATEDDLNKIGGNPEVIEQPPEGTVIQDAVQGTEQDRIEVAKQFPIKDTPLPDIDETNKVSIPDLASDKEKIQTAWPKEHAEREASSVALFNLDLNPIEAFRQVKTDFEKLGRSVGSESAQLSIQADDLNVAITAATAIMNDPEVDDATKRQVAIDIQDKVNNQEQVSVIDEASKTLADGAEALAVTPNDQQVSSRLRDSMEKRFKRKAQFDAMQAKAADEAFSWSVQTGLDLLASFTSINDVKSYTELLDFLEIKWEGKDLLLPGNMLSAVREHAASLTQDEQFDLAFNINEFLQENAGTLDTNSVQAVTMFSDIFNGILTGDPDRFNWEEYLISVGPILDLATVGVFSMIKNSFKTVLGAGDTTLNAAKAANPKAAKELVESALVDPDVAEVLGKTADDLRFETAPKPAGWKEQPTPASVSSAVESHRLAEEFADEAEKLIIGNRAVAGELVDELVEKAKGHSLWLADTEIITAIGEDTIVRGLIAKNKNYGFSSLEEAKKILKEKYNGEGVVLKRTNSVDSLSEVVREGKEVNAAAKQVIDELEAGRVVAASGKHTKLLQKEVNRLRNDGDALPGEVEDLERLIEQAKQADTVTDDLAKLRAGKFNEVSDATKARLDELTKDVKLNNSESSIDTSDYFIKVEAKGSIAFQDGDVRISTLGAKNTWVFDADSAIAPKIAGMGNVLFGKWKALEKEMLSHLVPFTKVKGEQQVLLSKILANGNKEGKVFTPKQLAAMGVDKQGQEAYRSFRTAMDISYTLENRVFRKKQVKDGMKYISGRNFDTLAKPLTEQEAALVKQALDPITGKIIPVPQGAGVARLRSTHIANKKGTNFVLTDNVKVHELPQQLLNNRLGWIAQTNKSNYFIEETTDVIVDGVPIQHKRTIGVAGDETAANARKAELNDSADDGVKYEWKHDRRLEANKDYEQHIHQLNEISNGLFYSKRGAGLTDTMGMAAETIDPLESAVSAISRISRDVTMKPFIADMKARFIKRYGHLTNNAFPIDAKGIHKKGKAVDKEVNQARRMFGYIDILEGSSDRAQFGRLVLSTSEFAEKIPGVGRKLAQGIRSTIDADPVSYVRGVNFNLNLATNPFAQIVLQPTQTLNMLGVAPKTFVQDWRRGRAISKLARDKADVIRTPAELASTAKTLGYATPEELVADIRGLRRSGLIDSAGAIDSVRDTAGPLSGKLGATTGLGRVRSSVVGGAKALLGKARGGFIRGEEINRGVHWTVMKRKWMKENPTGDVNSLEAQAAISAKAESAALSMIETGNFAYQRGIASIPMQYFAVGHKQLLLMTSNKALTGNEKMRVGLSQLAMWGPAGVGLGGVVGTIAAESGLDLSDGVLEVINDGLMESSMNGILSLITGEEEDLDFSGRFAAGNALESNILTLLAEGFRDGGIRDIYKVILGPTSNNGNRVLKGMRSVNTLFNTEEPTWKDVTATASDVLSVMSSYKNLNTAYLYKDLNLWRNKNNEALFPVTDLELIGKGVLGIQPNKLDEFYTIQSSKRDLQNFINDGANHFYNRIVQLIANTDKKFAGLEDISGASRLVESFEELGRLENAVMLKYGEKEAPAIIEAVSNKISKGLDSPQGDELVSGLLQLIMKFPGSERAEDIVQRAVNMGFLPKESVEATTEMVRVMMDTSEVGKDGE